jgi:type IX secretion system PorP/SprF family membrane protein
MKNAILVLLALFLSHNAGLAQLYEFSNPTVAPLHFNPGFAGSLDEHRVNIAYRNLWPAIPGSYQTVYASYDQLSNRLHGGFGGEVYSVRHAESNPEYFVSAIYAAKINLGANWTLSPAIKVGYHYRQNNGFTFTAFNKPGTAPFTRHGIDISPGILINTSTFYFGVNSAYLASILLHENPGIFTSDSRPVNDWKFQSGYRFQPDGRPWSVAATGVVILARPYTSLMGQLVFSRKWLLVGGGMGYSDYPQFDPYSKVSISAGFKHRLFRLLGVYDYSLSSLTNSISGASFEVSLMFYIPRKENSTSPESSALQ